MTPHAMLFGEPPSYAKLRVFGCRCFPNLIATSPHKLVARSTPCVFVGYLTDHRGYRCYNISTGRVITSRYVLFDEDVFPFGELSQSHNIRLPPAPSPPSSAPMSEVDVDAPHSPPPAPSPPLLLRDIPPHPTRARIAPPAFAPAATVNIHSTPQSTKPPLSGHLMVTHAHDGINNPNLKYALT